MNNILSFKRNRSTCVEQIDDETMKSYCRLQDTFTDAYECLIDINESLKGVIGVRIGPGMLKIIKGLMGEKTDCKELVFMVEECCHGIILTFTKEGLLSASKEERNKDEYYANMVKKNIRMYNRCAAFAPGSPLVEGLKPPA